MRLPCLPPVLKDIRAVEADIDILKVFQTFRAPVSLVARAVYTGAVYASANDQWLVLLRETEPLGPDSIVLEYPEFGPEWQQSKGWIADGMVVLGSWRVHLSTARTVNMHMPSLERWNFDDVLALADDVWPSGDVFSHIHDAAVRELLRQRASAVVTALVEPAADVREPLLGLLGLGPGATPSGDDFVVGLMAGLRFAFPEAARRLRTGIPHWGELVQITTISSAMALSRAVEGRVFSDLNAVLLSLRDDYGVDRSAVAKLASRGHTSGKDMLAGVVIGATMPSNGGYRYGIKA